MSQPKKNNTLGWVLLAGLAWLVLSGNPSDPTPDTINRVRLVVEEKAGVAPGLRNAMREHPEGLDVDVIDQHVQDGNGDVPERYRVALDTAEQHGLPILVIESDAGVSFELEPTEEYVRELWE